MTDAGAPDIEIPLEDRLRRVAERVQLLQDAAGLVVLVPAAWARVRTGGAVSVALGAAEIAAIVLALRSARRQLRGAEPEERGRERGRIDWMNLFMGAVLLLEYGFARAAGGKLVSVALLTGVLALANALWGHRLRAGRRQLRIDAEAIRVRRSALRRWSVPWSDLRGIDDDGGALRFRLVDGSTRTLRLRRYANGLAIREAVRAAAAAAEVPYRRSGPAGRTLPRAR